MNKLRTVIVGCGNIAEAYSEQIQRYSNVELAGFTDLLPERAKAFAEKYGGNAYANLDEVLADESVELIVNLTLHHVHAEIITKCLEAGKHVHSEKPLAMSYRDASALVALAEKRSLRLSSAPSTFLGEAQQTVAGLLRSGQLGQVRLAYAEMNHGRIEIWHPNPAPFYAVGPVWDVAVYPLGIWAAFCGPVRRVRAFGKTLMAHRKTKEDAPFEVVSPDYVTAMLDFESGMIGRLTVNFYVKPSKQTNAMEFHGDKGAIWLGGAAGFAAPVEMAPFNGAFEPVPPVREPYQGIEFARGVEELADAIREGRPHRCDGRMAAHVVEVIEGIHSSIETGLPADIQSTYRKPDPMLWALSPI